MQREKRLTRMRNYARSRREAEDGVDIVHVPMDGLGGHERPFTDRILTKPSGLDFISK